MGSPMEIQADSMRESREGSLAIASLTYQTVWVVGITFLLWYALMKTYPASKLTAFTFITPLFGVAAGHLVLNEPITVAFAVAVAFVVAGLYLVNRPGKAGPAR